ncbi:DUF7159 family protein [Mycobacteroides saopaulense]|uniref:DUF7159 domain-containing protein n=1 Tax=Mycobacteroides saopaulense TaxID=1578165 RepID=A0ABX3C367_9MYCO|nr:hypothetical protein [Mycobacteroides saopaulense]OHT85297.1 hypothetical protein BKG68_16015 [Mycobacteroides saopaulense]OHU11448.1 hypothetical protein BKG73_09055 [Mycobacteroides saopaulense]
MDVVLGVSMTPTTARLVLVEGAGADGRIVDTDTIIVSDGDGTASDQVLSAIVGTRDGMLDGGHHLVSTGVVWSDHAEAAALRDSLASRGIDGVEFFSALHAGGALAKAASSVTGYDKSALLVIEPDTATLAVVDSADGSIVGLASEPLVTGVTPGVLANLVNPLKGQENAPDGVFLLGLGTDVSDLTDPLGEAIALPVNSPDQPELALARGAALASAQEPDFEASTALLGQAYSLEGPTGSGFVHPDAVTEGAGEFGDAKTELREFDDVEDHPVERKPFLLVGAPLLLVFGICSIALAVSLTVTVRSTVDQGPSAPDRAVVQNPVQNPLPPEAPQQPAPAPLAEAPAPAAPAPAPVQQVVAPAPQHNPVPAAPKPAAPAPAQPAPQAPAPAPEAPPPPAAPAPAEPAPVAPPPAVVPVPIPLFPPVWEQPRRQENPWWAPPRNRPTYAPPEYTPTYTPPAQTWSPPTQQPPIISIPGLPPIGGGDSDGGSRGGSRGGSDGGSRGGWGDDDSSRRGSDGGSRGGSDSGSSRGGWGDSGSSRGGSDSGGSRGGWGGNGGSHGGGSNSGFPWPFGGR